MTMDLEAYASRYSGETRLQRLLLIARKTPDEALAQQAFALAEAQVKADGNIVVYKDLYGYGSGGSSTAQSSGEGSSNSAPPRLPSTQYDVNWVQSTEDSNKTARAVLQGRLSSAQSHLHKDAIRAAYVALAQHDAKVGQSRDALGLLLRANDYCTSHTQTAQISLLILELSLALGNHNQVKDLVQRTENTLDRASLPAPSAPASSPSASAGASSSSSSSTDTIEQVQSKLKIASGLAKLASGDYLGAANTLTTLILNSPSSSWEWSAVSSPEDICTYASLLALATQDRSDIQSLAEHPEALELVPAMREILRGFSRAHYSTVCSGLGAGIISKTVVPTELELYLRSQAQTITAKIQEKCVLEYLKPYQCVKLDTMAQEFGMSHVEDLLADMIGRGVLLDSRLDLREGILHKPMLSASSTDGATIRPPPDLAPIERRVLDDTYAMLIRLACLEHGLCVTDGGAGGKGGGRRGRGARGAGGAPAGGGQLLDDFPASASEDEDSNEDEDMMDIADGLVPNSDINPEDLY